MTVQDNLPNAVDLHVGARVRLRRKMLRMSQVTLGTAIGLAFQQVQKYESGFNRISASKLFAISKVLNVSVAWFFSGYGEPVHDDISEVVPANDPAFDCLAGDLAIAPDAEDLALAAAFSRVRTASHRRKIVELVRVLANDAG